MPDDEAMDDIRHLIASLGRGEYKDGSSARKGVSYHPIPFDYIDAPCHKDKAIIEEYNIISKDIGEEPKNILEIGCANGYYSFNLARSGHRVTAIDGDPAVIALNNYLKDLEDIKNISFSECYLSLENVDELLHERYDAIIMMNVHMWIFKQNGRYRTSRIMNDLADNCDVLYFQTSHAESSGMFVEDEFKNKEDLIEYLEDVGFTKVEMMNKSTKHGGIRYLFKCERKIPTLL